MLIITAFPSGLADVAEILWLKYDIYILGI